MRDSANSILEGSTSPAASAALNPELDRLDFSASLFESDAFATAPDARWLRFSDDWSIESVDPAVHGGFGSSLHHFGEIGLPWQRQILDSICSRNLPLLLRISSRLAEV